MPSKICTKCSQEKDVSAFYKQKGCRFGVHSKCKDCFRKKFREAYKDPSKAKAAKENAKKRYARVKKTARYREIVKNAKKRWLSNPENKEKRRLGSLRWKEKNPLAAQLLWREWAKKNQNRIKAWRRSPKGKMCFAESQAKRRAFYRQVVCSLTMQEWQTIKKGQFFRCAFCKKKKKLEMDHIHPLSKGGHHIKENIQGLCRSCNASKGAKIL